ncbi:MAG: response regulator [Cytophagales bacterium]
MNSGYFKCVMLVDDNDTDNFISKRIIELAGYAEKILVKNSGKSALEYLESEQFNAENLPDFIFLDINMPVVDGFVFLFEFEQLSQLVKDKCKIAILSSSDSKRDIERMVSNEFVVKFVTKPLTIEALEELKSF